jgi:hypothetical protein
MTTIPVDFQKFMHAHPDGDGFNKAHPDWPDGWETCCAKISCAFNATDPIGNFAYPDQLSPTGKARAMKLKDLRYYLLAVHDVRAYLSNKYGEPDRFNTRGLIEAATASRNGIIAFGLRHVDVWYNQNIHYPSNYNLGYLWDSSHWGGEKLMFWDVGLSDDDEDEPRAGRPQGGSP